MASASLSKRPLTAYLRFAQEFRQKGDSNLSVTEQAKAAGAAWKALPDSDRQKYADEYKKEKEAYDALMQKESKPTGPLSLANLYVQQNVSPTTSLVEASKMWSAMSEADRAAFEKAHGKEVKANIDAVEEWKKKNAKKLAEVAKIRQQCIKTPKQFLRLLQTGRAKNETRENFRVALFKHRQSTQGASVPRLWEHPRLLPTNLADTFNELYREHLRDGKAKFRRAARSKGLQAFI